MSRKRVDDTIASGVEAVGDTVDFEVLVGRLFETMQAEARLHTRHQNGYPTLDTRLVLREVFVSVPSDVQKNYRARVLYLYAAACALRRLLVDRARAVLSDGAPSLKADKADPVPPSNGSVCFDGQTVRSLIQLDEAIEALSGAHPSWANVAQCMFFGRMSFAETAAALDISAAKARTCWVLGRKWMHDYITGRGVNSGGVSA